MSIKDKLQEQNNNEIKTHKTTTEDPKIDASDKLPVPCQMDLDDPKSLSALKKLQDISDYNFEAVNMNNNSDTNELTKDITNKGETISPIKDNTNKEVTTENVHEKNKFDNEELRKQVSLDESEDENDSESEEEEDNAFTCMYGTVRSVGLFIRSVGLFFIRRSVGLFFFSIFKPHPT